MKDGGDPMSQNIFHLENCTHVEYKATMMALQKRLKKNWYKNHLIFFLFAGHGINTGFGQAIILNEFDTRSNFYKIANVEQIIRDIAEKNPNSYSIAIFACCRQNLELSKIPKCYSKKDIEKYGWPKMYGKGASNTKK